MVFLTDELWFPDPQDADEDGLLAIGGDLRPERLLFAYRHGIFPWFMEHEMIYWFCPPRRMVLVPTQIHIGQTMKRVLRLEKFRVTEDKAFEEVIRSCAEYHAIKGSGTWINNHFIDAYVDMFRLGHAHSAEVWFGEELVGGIYGVVVGKIFCGESMFSVKNNASKIAVIHLCKNGKYQLIDCQVPSRHMASLGAQIISRKEFLRLVQKQQAPYVP